MMVPASQRSTYWGRKLLLSTWLVASSAMYVAWQYLGGQQSAATLTSPSLALASLQQTTIVAPVAVSQAVPVSKSSVPSASIPTPKPAAQSPVPSTTPPSVPVSTPASKPVGQYTDGTYIGSTENAYYGFVQVQAVVQNGTLANVVFLQYPSDRSTSRSINSQAMPLLTQEAIRAQSASVNVVSGATFTSKAFQQSLVSALVQAKI